MGHRPKLHLCYKAPPEHHGVATEPTLCATRHLQNVTRDGCVARRAAAAPSPEHCQTIAPLNQRYSRIESPPERTMRRSAEASVQITYDPPDINIHVKNT